MTVRIGVNPITWSNDDLPALGGDTSLETCLSEAAQAGYAGIELGNKFPRDARTLRPILDQHGLALVSGWYSGKLLAHSVEDEIRAVEAHLTLLAAMGCTVMVYAETTGSIAGDQTMPLSRRPTLGTSDWRIFGKKLTEVAKHLAARGVRMAFHPHMGTAVETEPDIDQLMQSTGEAVGLLLDTGHLVYAGGDPASIARRYVDRINHVHCKDVRMPVLKRVKSSDASFLHAVLEGVFTVPGDGSIDYASVLQILSEARYAGWIVVEAEQDPAKAHPLTYATKGYTHVRDVAARTGLQISF